jgi:hypothetical protein
LAAFYDGTSVLEKDLEIGKVFWEVTYCVKDCLVPVPLCWVNRVEFEGGFNFLDLG